MVIVTNRLFLRTAAAQSTLLGKLARYWESKHGQTKTWIDWKLVAEKKVDMPGAPGFSPPPLSAPIVPRARQELLISDLKPVARYVAPRHNRIDEEPPAESTFPSLQHTTGAARPTALGRWGLSRGLAAVKHVTGSSPGHNANAEDWRADRGSTSRVVPHIPPATHDQDPFPSLTSGKNVTNLHGRWSQGPGRTKSRW